MSNTLFDMSELITNKGKTCRSCKYRERWKCGSRIIQYCAVILCGKTFNGKLKIKVTNQACGLYEEQINTA